MFSAAGPLPDCCHSGLTRSPGRPRCRALCSGLGGGEGLLLQTRDVGVGGGAKGRRALTTGLARAELALEDARELGLRGRLHSEGCPQGTVPDTQTETEGQGQRRRPGTQPPAKRPVSCEVRPARQEGAG